MLRELFETGPGLGWISPESRIRIEIRMLLVKQKRAPGRVVRNESGMVLRDLN